MPPKNANSPWTVQEENLLYRETSKAMPVAEIAAIHARTKGAITARQRQMGLRNQAGEIISPLPEFRSYLGNKEDNGARRLSKRKQRPQSDSSASMHASGEARSKTFLTVQQNVMPGNFPVEGNWIEKLWQAIHNDINALLSDGAQPTAYQARSIDIALSRLTPAPDFHQAATLEELGNNYGVTRERIRQVEKNLLRRLEICVRRDDSQTKQVMEKMAAAGQSESGNAPQSWFFKELTVYNCSVNFKKFMSKAFLRYQGFGEQEARRLTGTALSSTRRRRMTQEPVLSEQADKANKFVLSFLKKTIWPDHLNEQLIDLSGFRPLRDCKSERPYYSKTLERLVSFDSGGERRLIQALDCCTFVAEFVEQPIKIDYHLDGQDCTYVPDLLVRTKDNLFFVIEVKNRRQLADRKTLAKAEAAKRCLGPRGIGYCIADKNGFALDDLCAIEPDPVFRQRLSELLHAKGVVMRRIFERAFNPDRLGWAYDQLQSTVLREGMRYETQLTENPRAETRYHFDFRLRA